MRMLRRAVRAFWVDLQALGLVAIDPRTPWYAKALAALVAMFPLAPPDLVPDSIPVLRSVDALMVVPFGVLLVMSMIPPGIMAEHRRTAARAGPRPFAVVLSIAVTVLAGAAVWFGVRAFLRVGI